MGLEDAQDVRRRDNCNGSFFGNNWDGSIIVGTDIYRTDWKGRPEGGMEASDGMVWWKKFEPGSVQDARRREFCARL